MNLTKWFAAGLCLTAMTASAGFIKSNAFETGESSAGWFVGAGLDLTSTGIVVPNDTTNNRASYSPDATNRPYASAANTGVLALNTDGGIWTNTVDQSFLITTNVFVDMLVKFVPSEELPSIDGATVKMAVAVVPNGTSTNLAVSVFDLGGSTNKWIITATTIDPLLWYRVTVQLNYVSADFELYGTVKINGVAVNAQPYYLNNPDNKLNSIGFSGTGFIDEAVVRDNDPFASTEVVFGTGGQVILDPNAFDTWLGLAGNTGLTRENVGTALYNAFLMGVAVDGETSPELVVSSITVGGTTTLAVKAKYANGTLVDLGTLNNGAALEVWGKAALTDSTWMSLGANLDFNQPTYKFFMVTTGTNPNPI